MESQWHLSDQDFFAGIQDERQAFLARAARRELRKGDFIFHSDDPAASCFYLEKGVVRIFRITPGGKEPLFFLRKAGDSFGLAEVVAGQRRKCNAQAITPAVIHELAKPDFDRLIDSSPAMARRVIDTLGRRLRFLSEQIENLMACDVTTRLLKLLIYLGYDHMGDADSMERPVPLPFSLTQEQIASMTGSCQQTVSEVMKKLQEDGLVSVSRKGITLLKPIDILERIS